MFECLLLDLDDTILDFHKAERRALSRTLERFGWEPTEEVLDLYHDINLWHWKQMEKGLINRDQVLLGRFEELSCRLGRRVDPKAMSEDYARNLSEGHFFLPGAQEALEQLFGHYRLFIVSNGTAWVQHGRMTSANLYRFFEKVFISQEIGYNKPDRAFFDACFAQIPGFRPERALMVGDSLSSDILGGIQAGIQTVWVNPAHKSGGSIRPDYEMEALRDLPELLKKLEGGKPYGRI